MMLNHPEFGDLMMEDQIARTKKRLNELADEILCPNYGRAPSIREWGGADVVITSPQPWPIGECFYPEPRYVVTPNAKPLSMLFYDLCDAFRELLDCSSKIEFYGSLAMAALNYQEGLRGEPEDTTDLLNAVFQEAHAILAQMEQGSFPGWQWRLEESSVLF
jgi:hypothetical protein